MDPAMSHANRPTAVPGPGNECPDGAGAAKGRLRLRANEVSRREGGEGVRGATAQGALLEGEAQRAAA